MLDSLSCAVGALAGEPIRLLRAQLRDFDCGRRAALICGGRAAPDRRAFHNAALGRCLDFNDSYLAAGETCYPTDVAAPAIKSVVVRCSAALLEDDADREGLGARISGPRAEAPVARSATRPP